MHICVCAHVYFHFVALHFFVGRSLGTQNNILGVELKRGGRGVDTVDMGIFSLILVCPHNLNESVVIGNEENRNEKREKYTEGK